MNENVMSLLLLLLLLMMMMMMMMIVCVGSPYLVKVSGEVMANGSELTADEYGQQLYNNNNGYNSDMSHVGRDCQLTLRLPGTYHTDHNNHPDH